MEEYKQYKTVDKILGYLALYEFDHHSRSLYDILP